MTLRETVESIQHRGLGGLSGGYYGRRTALSAALERLAAYDAVVTEPQPLRIDEVTEKVKACLACRSADSLRRRDWRVVPWVMWGNTDAADHEWFLDDLFAILAAPDHPTSVVRSLVHAYVAFFDPARPSFPRVGRFLRHRTLSVETSFGRRWLEIDRRFGVFDPERAPALIAEHVITSNDIREALAQTGIDPERVSDSLAGHAFGAACSAVAREVRSSTSASAVELAATRLTEWNRGEAGGPRYVTRTAMMASKLLEAVDGRSVGETADILLRFFVDVLGDPRINDARWRDVSAAARDVAMRLLVKATLEDFFAVINATAEARHWWERREFWLGYYNKGVITDAWVAFGPRAATKARQLEQRYASLVNATDNAHSAVILRISDLVIVEWSHNGRCRFFPREAASWAPGCYDRRYDYRELNENCPYEYLTHMGSWQARFAAKIYRFTGVPHPKYGRGSIY